MINTHLSSPPTELQARLFNWRNGVLTAISFTLPMRATFIYILSALLLLLWIAEGQWKDKARNIMQSSLCRASVAYFMVYLVAMLWTTNTFFGWDMVSSQKSFLLLLLYWSCADPRYRERHLTAFIAGTCVCALLAFYNHLQLHAFPSWPEGIRVNKDPLDTAPFVDRILYSPLLALAAIFALWYALTAKRQATRLLALAASLLLVLNLVISGGRAGMVMFAALCITLALTQTKAWRKSLLVCVIALPLVFFTAYKSVDYFAERVDAGITDINSFSSTQNTSLGLRLVHWYTSFQIFLEHPLFGAGSGDLKDEYTRLKPHKWANTPDTHNPHNQYLMTAATTGLLGLITLLLLVRQSIRTRHDSRMLLLLAGYATVCLFEGYLWRSNTSLAFALMLAILSSKPQESVQS